ncbi:hypothetical protein J2W15_003153 [Pseudarthrobacter sulfonivorans]|nr:hypothetical protein [Pseudarthrobacter sulfonivorans]
MPQRINRGCLTSAEGLAHFVFGACDFSSNRVLRALAYLWVIPLVEALVMFIAQLTTVGIILIVAGIIRLTAYPIQAISRSFSRSGQP